MPKHSVHRLRGVFLKHDAGMVLAPALTLLAAWWHGDAGPVPCRGCSACCYYEGIVVDKKRDKRRPPHLLTERNRDGELVLQRRADGACVHLGT